MKENKRAGDSNFLPGIHFFSPYDMFHTSDTIPTWPSSNGWATVVVVEEVVEEEEEEEEAS